MVPSRTDEASQALELEKLDPWRYRGTIAASRASLTILAWICPKLRDLQGVVTPLALQFDRAWLEENAGRG